MGDILEWEPTGEQQGGIKHRAQTGQQAGEPKTGETKNSGKGNRRGKQVEWTQRSNRWVTRTETGQQLGTTPKGNKQATKQVDQAGEPKNNKTGVQAGGSQQGNN